MTMEIVNSVNPQMHLELRLLRPLKIDFVSRERLVEDFLAALATIGDFRLDAPPRTPLARLSGSKLLSLTERFPRRPPRVGATHLVRATAPASGLRLELQFRCSNRSEEILDAADQSGASRDARVVFLRLRGAAGLRAAFEVARPLLASAFEAAEALIVATRARVDVEPPAAASAIVAPRLDLPSYLAAPSPGALDVSLSSAPAEPHETILAPPSDEIARLIAEAEPRFAFQRATRPTQLVAPRVIEPASGETLTEPAPAELAELIARALPFSGGDASHERGAPCMDVDAYAVLQAVRSVRGDHDPVVVGRYPDPSPEGRARVHSEMTAYLGRDVAARARFEERLAHFRRILGGGA